MSFCQQGIVGKQAQRLLINHRQGSCDVRLLGNRQGEAESSKALEGAAGWGLSQLFTSSSCGSQHKILLLKHVCVDLVVSST